MKKTLLSQAVFATFFCNALTVFPLFANEPTIFLPEISVIGAKESSGTVKLDDEAETGTGLGLTIQETPASVEVVDKETIQERGDRTVLEAVDKTAGFTSGSTPASPGIFSVRGFSGNSIAWLYNGIRVPGGSDVTTRITDTANLERIEVLRGPASVLYGEGSIGAAVNIISRQPKFLEQPIEIDYGFSSFDSHRFHIGTGGSIKDDVAAYRFDASTNRSGSNVDDERIVLDGVTGSLLYKPTGNTSLTLEVDYMHDETDNAYFGTPLSEGRIDKSLRKINYNNLTDNFTKAKTLWVRSDFEWNPASDWEINNKFYYYDAFREWRNVEKFTFNDGMVTRSWWGDVDHDHAMIGDRIDALYKSKIGGMENRLLIGADFSYTDFQTKRNNFAGADTVDAYNPSCVDFIDVAAGYKVPHRDVTISQWSVFVEDQLSITPSFKLIGGLRHDSFDAEWVYRSSPGSPEASKTHRFFSWRLGAVYDFTSDLAFYASYATAVEPGGTLLLLNRNQSQLDLTEARQIELGLKQSFWDGKGEWTAAVYDIAKTNVFVPDPDSPGDRLAVGEQSSQGLELGLGFRPTWQWQIDANIAAVRARYDEYSIGNPPVSLKDNSPPFVPEFVANLGVRYMMTEDLGIGAWTRHVSSLYVDDANTIKLPAYTTLDLSLDYRLSSWAKAGVNVRNVTDELYATWSYASSQVFLADPRTYELFVNLKI